MVFYGIKTGSIFQVENPWSGVFSNLFSPCSYIFPVTDGDSASIVLIGLLNLF